MAKKHLANKKHRQFVHACACSTCRQHPHSRVAREHRAINRLLAAADERKRRLLAGLLAAKLGGGGIQQMARITGFYWNTIAQRQREFRYKPAFAIYLVRPSGAGRKSLQEKLTEP